MRNSTKAVAVLAAFAVVMLIGGCSVGIVDSRAEQDGIHGGAPAHTPSEPDKTSDETGGDTSGANAGSTLSREQVISAAAKVMRCDGEQTMLEDGVVIHVEGPCDRLILNTRGSQVAADDVTYLEVIGDGNVVLAGQVEKLLVNGRGNVVHWSGATPTVQDVGSENVLTAG